MQAKLYQCLVQGSFLTDEERDVLRWGRNATGDRRTYTDGSERTNSSGADIAGRLLWQAMSLPTVGSGAY